MHDVQVDAAVNRKLIFAERLQRVESGREADR